jgi:hypothetical protein
MEELPLDPVGLSRDSFHHHFGLSEVGKEECKAEV